MIKRTTLILMFLLSITIGFGQNIDEIFGDRPEVYFSFQLSSADNINDLTRIISIDNVSSVGLVYAYANKQEFENFLNKSISYKKLTPPSMLIQPRMLDEVNVKDIQAWDFYPTYDAYVDMMYQFEESFPDICEIISIGSTNNEREILVARISDNVGQNEGEPQFLYTSSIHGDETTGYVLMLRFIDYLLNGYGSDPRVSNMVDGIDIYINPLANPDGTYHSGNSNIYGATRGNALGVDMNRNYADPEDGPHPDGNPWQTETKHFMNFAEENHISMSANFHGGEEVLNYPWDTWPRLAADDDWWVYVCREYADTVHIHAPSSYMNGFDNGITNGYQWYSISGGRQDYMNYFHQARELTVEISNTKLLPASQLPAHWDYNYRSLLNYLEQVMFGLKGTVTDSSNGNPLKAEVYVLNHELDSSWVYSNMTTGSYSRLLNEGTYDIQFKKNGYTTQVHENVVIIDRQTTILDVELVPAFSSIGEFENENFILYPNPADGSYVTVKSQVPVELISIYSIAGELIMEDDAQGQNLHKLDISNFVAGTYIIKLDVEGKSLQRKFIRR